MKYFEQHEAFKLLAIQQGVGSMAEVQQAMPFGYSLPPTLLEKWFYRLMESPKDFSSQRRYVNRFKLGADPEFLFSLGGLRINADTLKLCQGLAYGMDNNGRLTEIRPYPHRSALNVTASILVTLRWLAILCPQTLQYDWLAGAFLYGDGLGGHVHFGRKRPNRGTEIKALDVIDDELLALDAYPVNEVMRRRQGDEHHQFYGLPGDFRPQRHGYEYRTFPSWLDSPALAFLSLTLSKLAVQNPRLTQGYMPLPTYAGHLQRIKNFLAYYRDADDDARLALSLITKHGLPFHMGGDFKRRWALMPPVPGPSMPITFVPSSIKPTEDDVQELFDYFSGTKALANRLPVPTWGPLNPPEGYNLTIKTVRTLGAKGLGELLWNVVHHKNFNYQIVNVKEPQTEVYFRIPSKLARILAKDWRKFCGNKIGINPNGDNYIHSIDSARIQHFDECRRLLLETVLPYWTIDKVKDDSYRQWQSSLSPTERCSFSGKLIYGDNSNLPYLDLR